MLLRTRSESRTRDWLERFATRVGSCCIACVTLAAADGIQTTMALQRRKLARAGQRGEGGVRADVLWLMDRILCGWVGRTVAQEREARGGATKASRAASEL